MTECHLLMGGDHGKGAFRMIVVVLLFSKNEAMQSFSLDFSDEELCGYIECKKDTYAIIKETIAKPLNDSLKNIAKAEELVFCKHETTGKQFVEWGADAVARAEQGSSIVHAIQTTLFMVSDLAYLLMAQGRDNMSSYWCFRCQFGVYNWKNAKAGEAKVGAAWTKENMEEYLTIATALGERGDARDKKGFTNMTPLFDAIPNQNFLCPVLHTVDLFVNSVMKNLYLYGDFRLENRPIQLMKLRNEEADAKIEEVKAREWLSICEQQLSDCRVGDEFEEARLELIDAKANHAEAESVAKAAAAKARKLEKTKAFGAMSQPLRQQVDDALAQLHHVLRSSYHGGDFEGNFCRKLMANADEVLDEIENLYLRVPRESRAKGCTDDEIKKYCAAFKRLLQYFNLLSHYCYQPYGSMNDADIVKACDCIDKMDHLWRKLSHNVPPMVHAWQHLKQDLRRLRGMKYHQESPVERAHQIGERSNQRFRALAGSTERKIQNELKWDANSKDPAVIATQEEVRVVRARTFGPESLAKRNAKQSKRKKSKEAHIEEVLSWPEITGTFLSLLELTMEDRRCDISGHA